MLSAGSKIAFQGAYAHGAIAYSGAGSPAGASRTRASTPTATARCSRWPTRVRYSTAHYHKSKAWSAAAQLTWKVSPNFEIDPEVSYASVEYDRRHGCDVAGLARRPKRWWVGAVFDWSPVKNLDFALDAGLRVVASGHADLLGTTVPDRTGSHRRVGTGYGGGASKNDTDGFNGRLHIVRSF